MIKTWILSARPKTLVAASCPVAIGTVISLREGFFDFFIFLFTLVTALGIQISTNMANDYFDFIRGADTSTRKGPMRAIQSGLVSLSEMRQMVLTAFTATALTGSYLVYIGGLPVAILLAISLLLAALYTAGPYPIAYLGLGDLFVFVFFGPIATLGTYYLQTHYLSWEAALVGVGPGLLSSAILMVANLRDTEEDRLVDKKTFSVRFGLKAGKIVYILTIVLAALFPFYFFSQHPFSSLAALIILPALPLIKNVLKTPLSSLYNRFLAETARLLVFYTILFIAGWNRGG